MRSSLATLFTVALVLAVPGCDKAYYGTMQKFGMEKRDILVSRVKEARTDQQEARDQFKTTLERFKELTGFDGGDLEQTYAKLKDDFDACETRANAVRGRVKSIEEVATALFSEWQDEADQIQNRTLRTESERMMRESRSNYDKLIAAMRRAESKMDPPLHAFKDQVLVLKHQLNAKMIASLQGDLRKIEDDVAAAIREMEESIAEANRFVEAMPLD